MAALAHYPLLYRLKERGCLHGRWGKSGER